MKGSGMLIVSLRGVNFGLMVSLGVFQAKLQYFEPSKNTSNISCKVACEQALRAKKMTREERERLLAG